MSNSNNQLTKDVSASSWLPMSHSAPKHRRFHCCRDCHENLPSIIGRAIRKKTRQQTQDVSTLNCLPTPRPMLTHHGSDCCGDYNRKHQQTFYNTIATEQQNSISQTHSRYFSVLFTANAAPSAETSRE
jgi:hypothetical protein